MSKKITDGQKVEIKLKLRYPAIEFDRLQMYFNYPYIINLENTEGEIHITIPSVGGFVQSGEGNFYSTINILTTNTTACRLMLWDQGIDWNDISDFELFCLMYKGIDENVSRMLFDDLNFQDFELYQKGEDIILFNTLKNVEINEDVYQHIAQYLRIAFNINVEEKITKDVVLKNLYIQKDRGALENKKKKNEDEETSIQPLISACINHPGFKYNIEQLKELSVYQFFDSVNRLNIYENSIATLRGMYSGFCDSSKIKPESYNFMRKI